MRTLILAVLLLSSCAALNPYAYSGVMTMAECRSQCASRAYPPIGVQNGNCICDTSHCLRAKRHGGCEQLPMAPGSAKPSTQM
mgnify:CR=1 FL=1